MAVAILSPLVMARFMRATRGRLHTDAGFPWVARTSRAMTMWGKVEYGFYSDERSRLR